MATGGMVAAVGGAGSAAGGAANVAGSGGSLTLDIPSAGSGGSGAGRCVVGSPTADDDHDGFTVAAGDCSDCDPAVNPGAYDFAGNAVDEDCSGTADDEPSSCDAGLSIEAEDAMDAAKSLGLCRKQSGQSWGVVAARWVFPNGEPGSRKSADSDFGILDCTEEGVGAHPDSRGILPSFGTNVAPRDGGTLLALSSGVARPGLNTPRVRGMGQSPGSGSMCTESLAPPGFPKDSPACPDVMTADQTTARDAIALELEIKTPTNARAFSFDFDFYTYEWPQYVCGPFNDFFVALLASSHPSTPADGNISFDKFGNPVSVNNGFVEVCDPATGMLSPGGKLFECALGTSELVGTGFDTQDGLVVGDLFGEQELSSHAATGWLSTTAAVVPGETIRLRFAIWDMLDEILDSTVLLDRFTWTLVEPTAPTTERSPPVR